MLPTSYDTPSVHRDCQRREPRTNMFVIATLASAEATNTVKVRNMSSSGAMIEGPALPAIGTPCVLNRTGLELRGEIVWSFNGRAGIRFDGTAQVSQWLPNGARTQSDVDRAVQDAKASVGGGSFGVAAPAQPVPKPPPAPLISNAVDAAQAADIADRLEDLADDLAGDPNVIARHMHKLQALDLAIQTLRKLATQG